MRLHSILALVATVLLASATIGTVTAQTPAASPIASGAADLRTLDIEGEGLALSPGGKWLAGIGPDRTPCFWDVDTLTSQCADEELPVFEPLYYPAMTWAPDSSAVAFSLDAIRQMHDSDIYLFERESGALTNLTDDGYDGNLLDAPGDVAIDIVPTWSPDGEQIAFSRSLRTDELASTAIMRIDRAGGEPVEVVTLDVAEPLLIWMPMSWLPDGTIVYTQHSPDLDKPDNGIWRVGVDSGEPEMVVPGTGDADIPAGMVADIDPATGAMSVYSPLLLGQYSTGWSQPLFWLGDLNDGNVTPLPLYDMERNAAVQATPAEPEETLAFPASPAALSPDGTTAFLLYRTPAADTSFATIDIASGELSFLDSPPGDVAFQPGTPQWADNGTILLLTGGAPLLVTLDPAD